MVNIAENRAIYDSIHLISDRIWFRKENIENINRPQSTAVAVKPVDMKSLESLLLFQAMQTSEPTLKKGQNFAKKYFEYAMRLYGDHLSSKENVQEMSLSDGI